MPIFFGMEYATEELSGVLKRYRFLLRHSTDPAVIKILEELIAETEARLREIHATDQLREG